MRARIVELLDQCQQLLERRGRWETQPPAPEKMMSTEPFSVDTLTFIEWLQWIYIARLRAILEAQGALPSGAQVAPYAEEALKNEPGDWVDLVSLIRQLDQLL